MKFLASMFVVLIAVSEGWANSEPLQIDIYYNSLSEDTANFLAAQLLPAYEALKDYISVNFIPFGQTYYVDYGDYFLCEYGPKDCYGNKLQLCALDIIGENQQAQVDFVACEMRLPFNKDQIRPECSESVGISWSDVNDCISNERGRDLTFQARQATIDISIPPYVYPDVIPTIVFNGVFDQVLQDRSLEEFATVVCEFIDNVHPLCV